MRIPYTFVEDDVVRIGWYESEKARRWSGTREGRPVRETSLHLTQAGIWVMVSSSPGHILTAIRLTLREALEWLVQEGHDEAAEEQAGAPIPEEYGPNGDDWGAL